MRKFSDIIGQKAIIEHLYNALRTGSISHAYILSGDAGSGRKTIASIFAAALQCEDLQEEETEEPIPGKSGTGRQPAPRMQKRKQYNSTEHPHYTPAQRGNYLALRKSNHSLENHSA